MYYPVNDMKPTAEDQLVNSQRENKERNKVNQLDNQARYGGYINFKEIKKPSIKDKRVLRKIGICGRRYENRQRRKNSNQQDY